MRAIPASKVQIAVAAVILLAAAWTVATAQYSWVVAGVLAVAAGLLLLTSRAAWVRPVWPAVIVVHLLLFLLYFWSWDESHTVVIHVTRQGAVATVDGDSVAMTTAMGAGKIGLIEPSYASYRITATGEAGQADTTSLMGRLAEALRLAQPSPAWADVSVIQPGHRVIHLKKFESQEPVGSWASNVRHELTSGQGAYGAFAPVLQPPYTVILRSVRPEGSANVLVDIGPDRSAYALQIRYDQPDLLWSQWKNGQTGSVLGASQLHEMYAINQVQRALRVTLPAYAFALFFALVAVGGYPIILRLFNGLRWGEDDDLNVLRRLVNAPTFWWAFPVCISCAGLAATASVSTSLLDRIPHVQDSVAYLFQAKIFANGMLGAPAPVPDLHPFFLEEYMPFHGTSWFSQYPPGHPIMLTLGVLMGFPWLVEPLLASLALGGVYLLGRTAYDSGTGALAALLGLSSPFWLFLGSEFMAHPTGLFFGIACLLCFSLTEQRGGTVWPLLAGLAAGMLVMTRQITAIGLLAPLVPYGLFFSSRSWRAYIPSLLTFAIPVLFLLGYNWVQMGNPFQSTYGAWDPFYTLGFGPHKAPFGDFTPGDGAWNAYQNLSMLSPQLFGWPYGIALSFAMLPFLLRSAKPWDFLLLASFLGIVLIHTLYWCACLMYGPRFYYEALPCLLLLTSRGMYELFRLPLRVWHVASLPQDETIAAFLPALLVSALLVFNLRFYLPAQLSLYKNYNFSSAAELDTVKRAHLQKALVFVVSNPPGFWASYGNVFFENDPRLKSNVVYAHDLGRQNRVLYRYFPGRRHYLLNGTNLTRIS